MAAFLQWRRFNFFDKEVVKDPETSQTYDKLKDINISASVSGRGQLIFGDHDGYLHMLNRELQINSFKAYEIRVSHLFQMKQHNLLISIGEDEQGVNPLIKVWNLEKMEKGIPNCTRISRAIPANKPTPVTCLAAHECLNWMAVGFENGSVIVLKGDITKDRHSKSKVVYENSKPITGLAMKTSGKNIILFVTTGGSVISINISAKQEQKTTLEDFGCCSSCSVMTDHTQDNQLVIGRQDAVYFYQPDGRGPCLAFEGEKLQLHWFRGYLIVVGKENKGLPRAPILGGQTLEMNIVSVYDIQNKFIAYTAPYADVISILCEWGSVYILSGDRKLYHLQEKDTQTKLEMLFKKNNYTLAISLAKSQQYDQDGLIDIFKQYGDHLYGKGDHDGAIDQYIKTIGKLEASYVIRKVTNPQVPIYVVLECNSTDYELPEGVYILYRSGIFSIDCSSCDIYICPKHRDDLGIHWRRQTGKCQSPTHPAQSVAKPSRGISASVCKELWMTKRIYLPVGSDLECDFTLSSQSTQTFSQTTTSDWEEDNMAPREIFDAAMEMLLRNFPALNSQLQLPWTSLSKSSSSYYTKIITEAIQLIAQYVAPGQENNLLTDVCKKWISLKEDKPDTMTEALIASYQQQNNRLSQMQILSLFANKHTKERLMELVPGLSVFKIDAARRHATLTFPGQLINPPKNYKNYKGPDLSLCLHYVSFDYMQFLDAQRIHNLTKYLQALHKAQQATEEHTTLLLNCYTKLKDVNKLDEFIMTKDREVDFDVETAMKVCRQAGYHKHALFLAEKHQKHEWYLRIQLEDNKDYQKALEYIGKLEFDEAEENLKKYGKMLISEVPQQTTELLKRLCTDYRPIDRPLIDQVNLDGGIPRIQKASAEEFIHIFVSNSPRLTEFLEHMIKVQPNSPSLLYNTLLELYLHDIVHEKDISAKTDKVRKTEDLLKNPEAKYDLDQALVLCQMNNFKAGILYLYEKAHLYQQILRYHMEHDDYVHVIDTCKKFGAQDSNLWVQALSYFARKEENCKPQLMDVLAHIDKKNLLPPLLVIQTLAHNSTATLSVVKDYIIRRLQLENDQITEDERLIKQYREDTEKKRAQIEELKTTAKIFQAAKCSICNHPLELPSVHFLCEPHSFHQHCFESYAENDSECPVCAAENRKIMDIIRAQEQSKDLHEFFHNQLERSQDGFSVVADYFGRGVFNKVTLITDSPTRQRTGSRTSSRLP